MKYLSLTNSPSTPRKGTSPSFGGGRGEVICLLLCLLITANAFAADLVWNISKTEADHVTATFTESDSVLTVSGAGAMIDNWTEQGATAAPWFDVNGVNYKRIIKAIIVEDGVTNIGTYAFPSINFHLTKIVIGDDVETIGDYAFAYLGGPEITFGRSVKSIGKCAFWNLHSHVKIELPVSLTTIDEKAFRASYITGIVIPPNVETIGYEAFYGCPMLKTVTVECLQPPALGSGSFPAVEVFYVPEEALSLYRSAAGWSAFDGSYRTIGEHTAIAAVRDENSDDLLLPSARYFTLQGQEVSKPAKGRIYIVKSGSKTRKMLVVK